MRKLFLLGLLTTICVFTATAQNKFRFGLHFSPNIGWIKPTSDSLSSGGSKLGFNYGLITEINFSERYAFATGLNVVKQGGKLKFSSGEIPITTQYIEIPMVFKLKTNEIGYLTYFGRFGLAPSFNIKANTEVLDDKVDYKSSIQPFRVALVVGVGTEYNISGDTRIIVGLDFNNGFTGILTKKAGTDSEGDRYKAVSNYVALTLGVAF